MRRELTELELLEEIRTLFADSDIDTAYKITSLKPDYSAWVVRFIDGVGVAVPYAGKPIGEEFANAFLYDTKLVLSNKETHCLILLSAVEASRNEFASFCRDFVYPGEDGKQRDSLIKDPAGWWSRWKLLIGNSIMEKRPYAILGELIMYEYLLRSEKDVLWEGPKSSSHDLVCKNAEYEVKSTLSRYEKIVHITGQFQLQKTAKRLFMYFCRFERNLNGICINDMVGKLVNNYGVSLEEINGKLSQLGYNVGNSSRNEKFVIHEVTQYSVDERFPRIIPEMFKQEALPLGIKQLSYDVDLSVVPGVNVSVIEKH